MSRVLIAGFLAALLVIPSSGGANTFFPGITIGLRLYENCADGPAIVVPGGLEWSESRPPTLYAANGRVRLGPFIPGTCAIIDSGAAATLLSLVCEPIPGVGRYVLAAVPYPATCTGAGCEVCMPPPGQDFR